VDEHTRQKNRLTDRLKICYPQALQWFDLDTALGRETLRRWPSLPEWQACHPGTRKRFWHQHHSYPSEQELQQRFQQIQAAVPATRDRAVVESGRLAVRTGVDLLEVLHQHIGILEQEIARLAESHPDRSIFASFPGAGPALMPRLIAAFGTHRERYQSAYELQCYSGIAPVTERSGKKCWTHFRFQCPKFLRQTFHEFALHSLHKSLWAQACYQHHRAQKQSHHAAVRAVAHKWLRIMYRCWKQGVPYDEQVYLESLRRRQSPYVPVLAPLIDATQIHWQSVAGFQKLSADFS